MIRRIFSLVGLLLFTFASAPSAPAELTLSNTNPPPASDPTDANIAQIEAEMLQTWQYSQRPFDKEIAGRFLDLYLETLDYSHMYFLQSDIAEFDQYRTNLQILTLQQHDMTPCWTIFARFMQRANERVDYVTNLLATNKFEFTNHDRFILNRHTLPYAKDMAEAHDFWRQELRCEYLDQILNAQGIEFTGKFSASTNQGASGYDGHFLFASDKSHPLDFAHFPQHLLGQNEQSLGSIELNKAASNATVTLTWHLDSGVSKMTNTLYSSAGQKIGEIRLSKITVLAGTNASSNTPPTTSYAAIIHLNETNLAAIRRNLTNRYDQTLDNYKNLENDRVFEIYMNALARAYDPHSEYMGHLQAENFAIQMKLSLFGIGAVLTKDGNFCKITELKEGPAKRSGLIKADDRIIAVAQSNAEPVDVVGMPLDKIVEMIRGPKGTQVTLTVIPVDAADNVHREVTLMRDEIKLEEQEPKARLWEVPRHNGPALKLGLIDLSSFYADQNHPNDVNTTVNVKQLINRLKQENVDGVILDLRRNGGGYLEEAIKLTGLFNPKGPVVQTKDPNGDITPDTSPEAGPIYEGPLVVLTSVASASASEIFAGALQDYGRALIVGDHSSFGKGTVQTTQPLSSWLDLKHKEYTYDPGLLKVTIKKFYRAGGVSTQLQGVLSDVELPSIDDVADIGEKSLPYALPCDSVTSADHLEELQVNRVKPYLAELQARSRKRLETDKDFEYIRQDIETFRKEQADKSFSLNKAEREIELKTMRDRAEAIKKERHSRKKSDEKAYEFTLKNLDKPKELIVSNKTNSVPADVRDAEMDADETPSSDDPAVDPTLDETKRILADYIDLLKKGPGLSQAH